METGGKVIPRPVITHRYDNRYVERFAGKDCSGSSLSMLRMNNVYAPVVVSSRDHCLRQSWPEALVTNVVLDKWQLRRIVRDALYRYPGK
jgi:hypothetical protein